MKLCQLASGQCFSVRPYAETQTGFKNYKSKYFAVATRPEVLHLHTLRIRAHATRSDGDASCPLGSASAADWP